MTLQFQRLVLAATFLGLHSLLGGCFAQTGKNEPVNANLSVPVTSDADRVEIMKAVRQAYETPAQKYLCRSDKPAIRSGVRGRFIAVFSEEILNEFFSDLAQCEVLASARFGFNPLDTPEAIKQVYTLKFAQPYTIRGETIAEVRFHPMIDGKPGGEGGAIVYLKKLKGGWRITNIESVDYLGANGFKSLMQGYPIVSSDVWSDMDYSKSLTRPEHRH